LIYPESRVSLARSRTDDGIETRGAQRLAGIVPHKGTHGAQDPNRTGPPPNGAHAIKRKPTRTARSVINGLELNVAMGYL
jgi:hypothetical protein